MKIGDLYDQINADYPQITSMRAVVNAVNRVIGDVNKKYPGIKRTEVGLTRVLDNQSDASFYPHMTQGVAVVSNAALFADVKPGDVLVVWDDDDFPINNQQFIIGRHYHSGGALEVLVPVDKTTTFETAIVAELVSYMVYRPKYRILLNEVTQLVIESASFKIKSKLGDVDFSDLGIKENDMAILTGTASPASNDYGFSVSLAKGGNLYLKQPSDLKTMANASTDATRIQVVRSADRYGYDPELYRIALPPWMKELREVFDNNQLMEAKAYEKVKSSDYSTEQWFNQQGRDSLVTTTGVFGASGDALTFSFVEDIPKVTGSRHDTEIEIPVQLDSLIQAGTLRYLLALPMYKDADGYNDNKTTYDEQMAALAIEENERAPQTKDGPEYCY